MERKVIHKRIPKHADYEELMRREGGSVGFGNASFRRMLDCIRPRCYVEAEDTHQGGDVINIIRDRYGIPVAAKVSYQEIYNEGTDQEYVIEGHDYIAMADVTFWEPWAYDEPVENYVDRRDDELYDDEEGEAFGDGGAE